MNLLRSMQAKYPGERGIIFCRTKRDTEALAALMGGAAYHAGLPSKDLQCAADYFLLGKQKLLCATTAFGVGVDIPNIRFSIHAGSPYSLTNFVQESGRIGRDGLPASANVVFQTDDMRPSASIDPSDDSLYEFLHSTENCLRALMASEFDGFPFACFTDPDTDPCQNCLLAGYEGLRGT
jgi:superfamily II DNA helicase RecQ